MIKLTLAELDARTAADKPVIIDFFATWCGPCKMFAPIFERVDAKCDGVDFAEVDIDEQPEMAERFGIQNVPFVVAMKGGEIVHQAQGIMTEKGLTELAERISG